ncbi:MAG: UDP-3-O-(3-hydroxymyristoyl)glucosamine N-acyltransferase [Ignavibacteriales bacterium]|nr:UDP-3-O-(3-hydroxymyristoyl)glucosamine N-acyltransferase [Ignavibacteriales bacterium]
MITANDIAKLLEGKLVGDGSVQITGIAKIEEAGDGTLSFIANPKYEKYLETTSASAVLVSTTIDLAQYSKLPPAVIALADPYSSFVIAIEKFIPKKQEIEPGIHPTAVIHPTARVGKNSSIGAFVVVAERTVIGDNAVIHPHVVIERDVKIGNDCLFYPHVTVREECIVGNRVIIQPGAVIGGDGFGFAPMKDKRYKKIPQLGIVVIEDDVEIQANTCIDRATLGDTRIKRGAKIDNLVQIAHNVIVGEDTVIAGLTGVAGSTKIGERNMIGGGISITGHISTADEVKIEGASAVTKSLDKPGQIYAGYPAKEAMKWRRAEGAIRQLSGLLLEIEQLKNKIDELEEVVRKLRK